MMTRGSWNRRQFLARSGLAALAAGTASATAAACRLDGRSRRPVGGLDGLRERLRLDAEEVHLAGLLLSSHPAGVREQVEAHRTELDRNPAAYVVEHFPDLEERVREEAARYLETDADSVALTESTTMGLAWVYAGVHVEDGQEFLTTEHDHTATHGSILLRTARSETSMRKVALYRDSASATEDEIVSSLTEAIRPETRVAAVTWVQSDTGLKIPLRRIAEAVEERNAEREPEDRLLLCVDGVHGLGVEEEGVEELGCDFFSAGTHKWLLGPRGTGVLWARRAAWGEVAATMPSFTPGDSWGARMTRGGFRAFEHLWSLGEAFALQRELGKSRVREHVHALALQCKEGLAAMNHVRLLTPMDAALSSGIVVFEVDGLRAEEVVQRLGDRDIVASVSPYTPSRPRLAPAAFNTPEEIETALAAVRELA